MSSTSSRREDPIWVVKDPGSFSSIHVKLPPGSAVHCESDGVVTFSQGVQVRGIMAGGFFGALARTFLANESFYTTVVENTNQERVAEVMIAPSDPGGIVLHKISNRGGNFGQRLGNGDGDDLLMTSGAYIASDTNVKVTSEVQGLGNSLFSDTGSFLLRTSAVSERRCDGYVAFGAYGSVHKYVLGVGETRSVDNGHLVAWSESMKYWVGLASSGTSSSIGGRLMNSMTSGEGLMCHFEGPGIVYLQSHKPDKISNNTSNRSGGRGMRSTRSTGNCTICIFVLFFIVILSVFAVTFYFGALQIMTGNDTYGSEYDSPYYKQNTANKIHDSEHYSEYHKHNTASDRNHDRARREFRNHDRARREF